MCRRLYACWANGGYFYVASSPGLQSGYLTPAAWAATGYASGDIYQNVTLVNSYNINMNGQTYGYLSLLLQRRNDCSACSAVRNEFGGIVPVAFQSRRMAIRRLFYVGDFMRPLTCATINSRKRTTTIAAPGGINSQLRAIKSPTTVATRLETTEIKNNSFQSPAQPQLRCAGRASSPLAPRKISFKRHLPAEVITNPTNRISR